MTDRGRKRTWARPCGCGQSPVAPIGAPSMGRRRSESSSDSRDHKRRRGRRHDDSRSRDGRRDSRSRGGRGGRSKRGSTLDRFIDENKLNESAASRLRGASTDVRERVMEQGWNVIDNARNASAVVLSRIRKFEEGGEKSDKKSRSPNRSGGGGAPGGVDYRDGDWFCDSCGAHNFARRSECFKCGAPRDSRRGRSRSRSGDSRGR